MNNFLSIIITAALEAGDAIMEVYQTDDFGVDMKSDNSPLTKADIKAHHIIQSYLDKTGIPVLSEEGRSIPYEERKNWSQLWIVDPLDGTKEFIKRNGDFTVNIALIENQVPIMGVVYAPAINEMYFSSKELGAFRFQTDRIKDAETIISSAIKLPIKEERTTYRIVASRSHLSQETQDFIDQKEIEHGEIELISKGSSLKLCMIADGSADCYPRYAPTMEWDTAAGQAICLYAGAEVIDWNTKKSMLYNRENLLNNWFIVERGV